jgi:type IV pilus assembly protein PilA
MKKMRKNNKGFTLVELIIVVAIIAVLSAVVAPQYIKYVERSRQGVDAATLEEVRHAAEVEAAINPPDAEKTVTISSAGAIDGTFDGVAQVEAITNDPVTFKSKGVKSLASYVIKISADGKVTWDGSATTGTMKQIADLQAGKASTTAAGNNQQNNNEQN